MICEHESGFLSSIGPLLERNDRAGVIRTLSENWPASRLVDFFSSDIDEVVRLAAVCLGMIGHMSDARYLSHLLAHETESVVTAAEDALWSVWMRAGSDAARNELALALRDLQSQRTDAGLARLERLCLNEADFAEAHHQRGMALHGLGFAEEALAEYREALELNPLHFAALASIGHLLIEQADYSAALQHYRSAVAIHPHIADLPELLPQLEQLVQRRNVA